MTFCSKRQKNFEEEPERYPGNGTIVGGRVGGKEIVDFKERIGCWVDKETGVSIPTTFGVIHYTKDAVAHIIPANPRILETTDSGRLTEDGLRAIASCTLLCAIRPNTREIYIEYSKKDKRIDIYAYFDQFPSDDEIEDINRVESEMLSDCTMAYNFDYKIIHLPHPAKSYSRGMCIYRRYEPNPKPEPLCQRALLVAANTALLGRIHPNLREIDIVDDEECAKVDIFAYFDTNPSDDQVRDMDAIMTDMKEQFLPNISWRKEIVTLPFPEKPPGTFSVYRRYEPWTGGK